MHGNIVVLGRYIALKFDHSISYFQVSDNYTEMVFLGRVVEVYFVYFLDKCFLHKYVGKVVIKVFCFWAEIVNIVYLLTNITLTVFSCINSFIACAFIIWSNSDFLWNLNCVRVCWELEFAYLQVALLFSVMVSHFW